MQKNKDIMDKYVSKHRQSTFVTDQETIDKLNTIKEFYDFNNQSSVIKMLIHEEYDRLYKPIKKK